MEKFLSKLLLPFGLAAFLIIQSVMPVFAASLSDTGGHVYEGSIDFLLDEEILHGYPDGTFKADIDVNRVEYLKVGLQLVGERSFSYLLLR